MHLPPLTHLRQWLLPILLAAGLFPTPATSYPLDGHEYTGIPRLKGYALAQTGQTRERKLPPGSLLSLEKVQLRLLDRPELKLPKPDKAFSRLIQQRLGENYSEYGIAVLDLTDLKNPAYAEINGNRSFNPGSLGKLAILSALFNALAKAYPNDIGLREQRLRNTLISADEFIIRPSHVVPFWDPAANRLYHRKLRIGDTASLWTFADWMASASANAAASMVLKQALLIYQFGQDYPLSEQLTNDFFQFTPKKYLGQLTRQALDEGVAASGLTENELRQGGFFTSMGKRKVPAGGSRATPRGLIRYLLHLEQGKVVDPFSSRETKRLIYNTQRRIRFASSPALKNFPLYFKSGSLYQCQPEPGYRCEKYKGNKRNLMNSVAIIESAPGDSKQFYYFAVISSNVLKENAAVAHQSLATWLHRLIEERHLNR